MLFEIELRTAVQEGMSRLFHLDVLPDDISIQPTRKDFDGDLTVVVFNLAKKAGKSPDAIGKELSDWLATKSSLVSSSNVVKGFLNVVFQPESWLRIYEEETADPAFFEKKPDPNLAAHPVLVEYSSPNTNKPLHLGHVRNNLLGFSIAELLKASGTTVKKVNLINDRGIHICKSMLAWQKLGNGETPASSGMKGDHLVGKYYVEFDRLYKAEIAELVSAGMPEDDARKKAGSMVEAQEMLRKWEAGDEATLALWKMMNEWVYAGFNASYKQLGVDFDKFYYESEMYLVGKELVLEGLKKGVFFQKPDGSVWVDLTDEGLDQKLLLRSDGTSVYITQDIGTSKKRFDETGFSRLIYVVGNEQDYHFKVLKLVIKKLGYEWWDRLYHLSYNMVDLPQGKMKSREGTVVDADDLMKEMIDEAGNITRELGKISDFESEEATALYNMIGMGALKYFILKVDPEKRMLFNPAESIDFNGNTGPFIQYTYARIKSVLRKGENYHELKDFLSSSPGNYSGMNEKEKVLIKWMLKYPFVLGEAAERLSPAVIANYVYELAKIYNQFYHEYPIVDPVEIETSKFRMHLSMKCAGLIQRNLKLLGIEVPERM
ncbi:MAG: arginine--tRNA ligase [Bacteroidetes bacterium]|nr:arginine--tRNA ligase [Bacteroidota bacterium]